MNIHENTQVDNIDEVPTGNDVGLGLDPSHTVDNDSQQQNHVNLVEDTRTVEEDEPPSSPHIVKSKKKIRRVHFPDDDKIISEKIPPPNPWKNVADVSTEELVAAYHAACASNQVKPSSTIIQQLQKMTDLSSRVNSFTFQGEKIDQKTAETLEEIFRRVQFSSLDVEGCNIEDEAAVALFEMVEFYETAVKISMSSVKGISIRGWQAASKMMRKSSCLQVLDISRTTWSEHSVPILCRAIRADTSVSALHLEACNLAGRPLVLLMSALRINPSIRELFLADNRLMPSDAFHIGGMLKHNTGLKLLDLRNNNMQDVGVSHISDGLAGQMRGQLNTLVLWNNHITHVGAGHLGKTLPMITTLETLNIGQNNLGIDGIMKLKEGLMKNKFLQRMGLFSCRINDEGAIALAEYLADNCQLIRLDLRENDIRTGGLMALSRSLKLNKVLLRLDLDKAIKKENLNGHAELQQQFLEDIDRSLLDNRQRREECHQHKDADESTVTEGQDEPINIELFTNVAADESSISEAVISNNHSSSRTASDVMNGDIDHSLSGIPVTSKTDSISASTAPVESSDTPSTKSTDASSLGIDILGSVDAKSDAATSSEFIARVDIASDGASETSAVNISKSHVDAGGIQPSGILSVDPLSLSDITKDSVGINYEGEASSPDYTIDGVKNPEIRMIHQHTFNQNDLFSSSEIPDEVESEGSSSTSNQSISSDSSQVINGSNGTDSPPGIRINENIKLLTVSNHVMDGDVDLNKGLDLAGQQLMASAIEEPLPSKTEVTLEDNQGEHLSQNLKNILPPTPTLLPLQDSQS